MYLGHFIGPRNKQQLGIILSHENAASAMLPQIVRRRREKKLLSLFSTQGSLFLSFAGFVQNLLCVRKESYCFATAKTTALLRVFAVMFLCSPRFLERAGQSSF
jgi:hypothetical protein